jgi:hypothetical protein
MLHLSSYRKCSQMSFYNKMECHQHGVILYIILLTSNSQIWGLAMVDLSLGHPDHQTSHPKALYMVACRNYVTKLQWSTSTIQRLELLLPLKYWCLNIPMHIQRHQSILNSVLIINGAHVQCAEVTEKLCKFLPDENHAYVSHFCTQFINFTTKL